MSGDLLKAQSISIQVSNRTLCNGGCKCCISRTTPNTPGMDENKKLVSSASLKKGLDFAEKLGATHVILTGKAEPTQEPSTYLHGLASKSSDRGFLVDMHTNGFLLQPGKSKHNLKNLCVYGLTMITFSIFSHDPVVHKNITGLDVDFDNLIREANSLGLLVRVSLVLTKSGIGTVPNVLSFIKHMGNLGVHMVVIRELWLPASIAPGEQSKAVYEWNNNNLIKLSCVSEPFRELSKLSHKGQYPMYELAPLPWGARVFAMEGCFDDPEHGVNITFAHCEENDKNDVIKSVVHKPNGHGYRNWDFNANILY